MTPLGELIALFKRLGIEPQDLNANLLIEFCAYQSYFKPDTTNRTTNSQRPTANKSAQE